MQSIDDSFSFPAHPLFRLYSTVRLTRTEAAASIRPKQEPWLQCTQYTATQEQDKSRKLIQIQSCWKGRATEIKTKQILDFCYKTKRGRAKDGRSACNCRRSILHTQLDPESEAMRRTRRQRTRTNGNETTMETWRRRRAPSEQLARKSDEYLAVGGAAVRDDPRHDRPATALPAAVVLRLLPVATPVPVLVPCPSPCVVATPTPSRSNSLGHHASSPLRELTRSTCEFVRTKLLRWWCIDRLPVPPL